MADETNQDVQDSDAKPESADAKSPKKGFFARFLNLKSLAILLGITVAIQGFAFLAFGGPKGTAAAPCCEIGLGQYHFEADRLEVGRIGAATFSLHIALLEQVDRTARQRLEARKFRVQQSVEQLLRKAHSGDFDDPDLGGLKRQLQEQINETLGMRAIADVIVTDLTYEFADTEAAQDGETAPSVPWVEKAARKTPSAGH